MANSYFQFKQFTIHQDRCAMKVCTDACILGAWFAAKIPDHSTILDIGSGTGLLMMMLAQQSQSEIHGIEIDLSSFSQLRENIGQNRWKERLKAFPGDAKTYAFPTRYDFIITNPPFFENDLLSASEEDRVARHSKHLTLEELTHVVHDRLEPHGAFGILLPYHRMDQFDELARRQELYPVERLLVKQTAKHDYFRAIVHYSRSKEGFVPSFDLIIRQQDGSYTPEFRELMKDYYLYL